MRLTAEELAAKIQQILAGLGLEDPGVDAILTQVNAVFGEGEEPDAEDGKEADAPAEGGDDVIGKIVEALQTIKESGVTLEKKSEDTAEEQKGSDPGAEQKSAAPERNATPQRKYRDLFVRTEAQIPSTKNEFKSRVDSLQGAARRNLVYGTFGRAVKCVNACGGDMERASYIAEKQCGDSEMAREFKALTATLPNGGGYLIPEVYANEIIEELYPATVVNALGARRVTMANGNLNIPKMKTGVRAHFVGEARTVTSSRTSFTNLKLSAKKLMARALISNDLMRFSNFDNDVIVGQDLVKQMALGIDFGALKGRGNEFEPLGLLNNKAVKHFDVTKIGTDYADADGKLTAAFPSFMVGSILKDNVLADGLGYVFNTSVEQYFKSMRDNVGGFIFADEMNERKTLFGYPYMTTNQIETDKDGCTSILFGNWNDMIIGEYGSLQIDTSQEAASQDDDGNLISIYDNDLTVIRAITFEDTALRHDESFAIGEKVKVPAYK